MQASLEISPEPTAGEREAILEALSRLRENGRPQAAWWLAGLREAVLGEDGPEPAP